MRWEKCDEEDGEGAGPGLAVSPSGWMSSPAGRGVSWCGRARGLLGGPRLPTPSCFRNVLGVPGRRGEPEKRTRVPRSGTLTSLLKAHPPPRVPGGFLPVVASLPASWGPCCGQSLELKPGEGVMPRNWGAGVHGLPGGSPQAMPPRDITSQ